MAASFRAGSERPRPDDVGILALEVYFPTQKVSLPELEQADGCPGKYTAGLGQEAMAFTSDREDAVAMALTVTHTLLEKYGVRPDEIGHLQVATESGVDRSKSLKSHLMQLFQPSQPPQQRNQPTRPPPEGVDVVHACYGGTAAVLAAAAWVESRRWDGRLALVVATDVALYPPGSAARPTGGCGAAALLVGPHAALVLDPLWYGTHVEHSWDFYKPLGELPYPEIHGMATLEQFLGAAAQCGLRLAERLEAAGEVAPGEALLPRVHHFVSHSPFSKLARKGLARIILMDRLRAATAASRTEGPVAPSAPSASPTPQHQLACPAFELLSQPPQTSESSQRSPPLHGSATQNPPNGGVQEAWVAEWVQEQGTEGRGPGPEAAAEPSGQGTDPRDPHPSPHVPSLPKRLVAPAVPAPAAPTGLAEPPDAGARRGTCEGGDSSSSVAAAPGGPQESGDVADSSAGADAAKGRPQKSCGGGADHVGSVVHSVEEASPSGRDGSHATCTTAKNTPGDPGADLGLGPGERPPESYDSYAMWRLQDKSYESWLLRETEAVWREKGGDAAWMQKQLGNSYTACMWQCLASLVWRQGTNLYGRRLLLYAFGSGTVATLYSIVVRSPPPLLPDVQHPANTGPCPPAVSPAVASNANAAATGHSIADGPTGGHPEDNGSVVNGALGDNHSGCADPWGGRFTLTAMQRALDLDRRLAARVDRPLAHFNAVTAAAAEAYSCPVPYEPSGDLADMAVGSYYLVRVDKHSRRFYERKGA